jgi:hypothetical protein
MTVAHIPQISYIPPECWFNVFRYLQGEDLAAFPTNSKIPWEIVNEYIKNLWVNTSLELT